MAEGEYRLELPIDGSDEVAELGQKLNALASTLERRFGELLAVLQLSDKINAALLVDDVLDEIYDSFRAIIPYDRIGCSLLESDGRIARAVWARSELATTCLKVGFAAPLAGSSLATILETGQPRILNDLEVYLAAHPTSTATRLVVEEGIRSSLTCPLATMGKPIGFLFFSSARPNTYRDAHVSLFLKIAAQVSSIVEKGRLYRELVEAKAALEQANQSLLRQTLVDGLTSIPNRRALDQRLSEELRRAIRNQTRLTVAMMDIDNFKKYNDRFGHVAGDECLIRVATELAAALRRPVDFVGRYGGEEFCALLDARELDEAQRSGERMRARVEALALPHAGGVGWPVVTLSIGVASGIVTRGASVADLLAKADQALYRAKTGGRNRVELATF